MAKDFKLLAQAYSSIRKKEVVEITEQTSSNASNDLGAGFESDALVNKVLADFNIDVKDKTKVIEFLISLSKKEDKVATISSAPDTATPTKSFISNLAPQTPADAVRNTYLKTKQ